MASNTKRHRFGLSTFRSRNVGPLGMSPIVIPRLENYINVPNLVKLLALLIVDICKTVFQVFIVTNERKSDERKSGMLVRVR